MSSRILKTGFPLALIIFMGLSFTTQAQTVPVDASSFEPIRREPDPDEITIDDMSDEEALKLLGSDKTTDILNALKRFDKKLPLLLQNNKHINEYVDQIISLITHSTISVRDLARTTIKKNMPVLFENKILSKDKITKLSKASYSSEVALWQFVGLIDAVLPEQEKDEIMEDEYCFQIVDGMASINQTVSEISTNILTQNGIYLVEKEVWHAEQTRLFLTKLSNAAPENQPRFFSVLNANLAKWVEMNFLTKNDLVTMLNSLSKQDPDTLQELTTFMTDPKVIPVLSSLDFFDTNLTESLLETFYGSNSAKKQTAFYLITALLKPLSQNQALTQEHFRKLWSEVSTHLSGFDDPFALFNLNLGFILKNGWFTRGDFEGIVTKFAEYDTSTQKQILNFLDTSYRTFSAAGWIDTNVMSGMLFSKKEDITLQQLKFIIHHPDLVTQKQIVGPAELEQLANIVVNSSGDLYQAAIDVFTVGFETWSAQHLLDSKLLGTLLTIEPAQTRTAKLVDLLTSHFIENMPLFDEANLQRLSDFTYSSRIQVQESAKAFFDKALPILNKKHLATAKLKKNLRDSGLWKKLPV